MSKIALQGNSSGTGTLTIASPNTNTDRTLTLPDVTGTINTSGAVNEVPAGSASAPAIYPTGDTNTGIFFPAADTIAFAEGGAEAMRIDSSGNVGIGRTPSSGYKLDVQGSSGFRILDNDAARSIALTPPLSTGEAAFVDSSSANGLALRANNASGFIYFATGGTTERLRIDASGNLISTVVYAATVGATNRDLYIDNTGKFGYVSSLRASKTDIQDITDTSWLYQLNPVSFKYRKKDKEGNYTDETDGNIQYGMIAEDVEQVRPDLCFYDEVDGNQELRGIQYSKLVPVMLKAIQELSAKLDEANERIAALEAK